MSPPTVEPSPEAALVLAPTGRDAHLVDRILGGCGFTVRVCADLDELLCRLDASTTALLLAEEALAPPGAERLAAALAAQPPWSDLPLLVFSSGEATSAANLQTRTATERLANVTLLDRPVRIITLVNALRGALRYRARQHQIRDLLGRLEAAVRDRDRFLAMLGHELRNPLAAIVLSLELLGREGPLPPSVVRRHETIARQSRHLARVVDDLLEVSRVTSGRISLRPELVDLVRLVERGVEVAMPEMTARRHDVELALAPGPVLVLGDPVRLEQIISNLLTNARKYTPPGGRVRVSVGPVGDRAALEVADNGVGIPGEMLERIFDPFTQIDQSLDRSLGGLGLGLAVVRALVGLHGGTVEASSPGPSQGSRFTVTLPLAHAPGVVEPLPSPRPEPAEAPCSVVVVEDNPDIGECLKAVLQASGHHVDLATDGPSGVATVLAEKPAAALVDLGLPGFDGYEVARLIRASLGDRIFLAAVSGYGLPEDQARARAAGFDAHLTKPVAPDAVEAVLKVAQRRAA